MAASLRGVALAAALLAVGCAGQGIQCRAGAQLEAQQCTSYSQIATSCNTPFLRCSNGLLSSVSTNCSETAERLRSCVVSAVTTASATDTGLDLARNANVVIECQGGALFAAATADCLLFDQLNYVVLGLPRVSTSTTTTSTVSTPTTTTTRTTTTQTLTTATFTTGHFLASRNGAASASPGLAPAAVALALAAALASGVGARFLD